MVQLIRLIKTKKIVGSSLLETVITSVIILISFSVIVSLFAKIETSRVKKRNVPHLFDAQMLLTDSSYYLNTPTNNVDVISPTDDILQCLVNDSISDLYH